MFQSISMKKLPALRGIVWDWISLLATAGGLFVLGWVTVAIIAEIFLISDHPSFWFYPTALFLGAVPAALLGFSLERFGEGLMKRDRVLQYSSAISFVVAAIVTIAEILLPWSRLGGRLPLVLRAILVLCASLFVFWPKRVAKNAPMR